MGTLPTLAASPSGGSIDATTTSVTWQGATFTAASYASSGVVPEDQGLACFNPANGNQPFNPPVTTGPTACDVYTLTVNLDASYWQTHAGGVTVKLSGWHANADGVTDDIDLYIYKHNSDGTNTFVTNSGNAAGIPETATIVSASGTYYVAAVGFAVSSSSYVGSATLVTHSVTPPTVNIPGQQVVRASHDAYNSHSEPYIAMNPTNHLNLIAGSKQYVDLAHYRFKIGTYYSFDGGQTWTDNGHLGVTGSSPAYNEADDCDITSDIWMTFDDQGTAYAMVLHDPSVPDTSSSPACPKTGTKTSTSGWNMELWKSADGGRTWTGPVHINDNFSNLVQRQVLLDDKNAIAVDNYSHPAGKVGTLYACWELDSNPGVAQQLAVAVSNDAGATWSSPTLVSIGETRELGCQISIAKSGSAIISYFDYANNQQMYVRSDDHGLTWSTPQVISSVNPIPSPFPGQAFRNQSLPGMAYSAADDSLYIVWSDYGTHNGVTDADILLSKASVGTSGALTWSAPVRVNQDPVGNGKDQFQPAIAITESGQVDVSYFDRRNDPDNFFIDTYLSRSNDGGAHWTDTRVTSAMSNPQVNPPIDSGGHAFYGDYQGLVADDRMAIPFFNATFLANLSPTDPAYSPWQEVFAGRVPNTLPDLKVSSMSANPNPVNEGDRFSISATVTNAGYADASNVAVRFAVDGVTQTPDQTIASLPQGQSATVSIPWDTHGHPGQHTAVATADPANTVKELDETNNSASLTFTVRGNHVTNGSFEQVTTSSSGSPQPTGWTPNGNVIWDNTGKYATDGAAAAGVVASLIPGQAGSWTSQAIAVTPGAVYSISASVTSVNAANPTFLVIPSGSGVTTAVAPILSLTQPLNAGVNQLAGQVTIPAGVSDVVIVLTDTADDSTHTVFFDKVGLFGND
jgi:hypothetical protein